MNETLARFFTQALPAGIGGYQGAKEQGRQIDLQKLSQMMALVRLQQQAAQAAQSQKNFETQMDLQKRGMLIDWWNKKTGEEARYRENVARRKHESEMLAEQIAGRKALEEYLVGAGKYDRATTGQGSLLPALVRLYSYMYPYEDEKRRKDFPPVSLWLTNQMRGLNTLSGLPAGAINLANQYRFDPMNMSGNIDSEDDEEARLMEEMKKRGLKL